MNPKYDEILGLPCVASVAEIAEPVDLVILAVSNALLEEQLRLAAEAGAGSAVIFASGYEEPRDGVQPLTERLAAIARRGMAICGGNCMGFANLERHVRALGFYEPKDAPVGGVTFLSHSGSAFSAMIHNDRALGLNLAVSAGQEFVTTVADYLRYALGLESTKAVGLFIETVRSRRVPFGARARERTRHPRRGAQGRSGGAHARARWPRIRARSRARTGRTRRCSTRTGSRGSRASTRWRTRSRCSPRVGEPDRALASVHDSGGERALLVDAAASVGVPLAEISDETSKRMEALLDPGLPPVNPLDFWGTGRLARDHHRVRSSAARGPAVAALAFAVDLTSEEHPEMGYIAMARETFRDRQAFAMLSNFSSGIDRSDAKPSMATGSRCSRGR